MSEHDNQPGRRAMRVGGKDVTVFPATGQDAPLVLLHTVRGEGPLVHDAVRELTDSPFSLAAIGDLNWDDDMTPWPIPPISADDSPCAGLADHHLATLTQEILPEVGAGLPSEPSFIALSGYSLAGLFAVYALYRTDVFDRVASASGSFWYPGFIDFAMTHEPVKKPDCVYFSLGDTEENSPYPILQPVRTNTERLAEWYRGQGVRTTFELNPGDHFRQGVERLAKAIAWVLER